MATAHIRQPTQQPKFANSLDALQRVDVQLGDGFLVEVSPSNCSEHVQAMTLASADQ
jgi:hypothetical protein